MNNIQMAKQRDTCMPLSDDSFSRRLGMLAVLGALIPVSADVVESDRQLDNLGMSIPSVKYAPSRDITVWQNARVERTGPCVEGGGVFDWVHRYTPGSRQHLTVPHYEFISRGFRHFTLTTAREFVAATSSVVQHEQWKDVLIILAPREIKEYGKGEEIKESTANIALKKEVVDHYLNDLAMPLNCIMLAAQKCARQSRQALLGCSISINGNQIIEAKLSLAGPKGPYEVDIRERLLGRQDVRELLKQHNQTWSVLLQK